jgi:CheY-like chemotaxis protein
MSKRILITEDIADLRTVLKTVVESLGYECLLASNGKEAVAMAASEFPDVIMMDVMMPQMDGFTAASLIRQNPKTQSIPILAVTVLNSHKKKQQCLESGYNDVINKPFTPSQLAARLEKLLKESSTES